MNRIAYLAHAVKLTLRREAAALRTFKIVQDAWAKAGCPEDLNRARHAACHKAEVAIQAREMAEAALVEAQIEAMDAQEQSDHFQALAEIRAAC